MQSSKKYALNTSWILIEKVSRIISGVLVGILVARYLGPEQFGLISYALNVVAIFSILSTLGLDGIMVRSLITEKEQIREVMGTGFILRLVGAVGVVILATLYSSMRDDSQTTLIVFWISTSVLLQSFSVIDIYFQSTVSGKYTAINQVITLAISSVVKLVLILMKYPVEVFALVVILEAFLTMVNQIIFYRKQGQSALLWRFNFNQAKSLLMRSWPIIASGLILIICQKMDQILIKRWLNMTLLGNYAAAARISEASYFIPTAICAAVFPGIINTKNNPELHKRRLTQLYSIMIWAAIIICIGGMITGDFVISSLYKEKYSLAPQIFKIHIWASLPVFIGVAWSFWILSENKQHYLLLLQICLLIIIFSLNRLLIQSIGVNGAAYALVITQVFSLIILLSIYKPSYSWSVFIDAINPRHCLDAIRYIQSKESN